MKRLSSILLLMMIVFAVNAQKSEIFCTDQGAINGYDPVAFFTMHKPVQGKRDVSYTWKNAEWHFASADNKKAFIANPLKYAPQYGGYCAYGTAQGHKAPTLPETWTITNNMLYFNYNMDIKKQWSSDQKAFIQKADKNWPTVKDSE
ncbi:MAG TPA: YHS domain-containing (seleno)protein [Cyclobacteriaceae bacterium]|jgi:hypothetical protein|nr:YHS domain-containing (seleno)protein [Cyclobacteriaceae bacterium]